MFASCSPNNADCLRSGFTKSKGDYCVSQTDVKHVQLVRYDYHMDYLLTKEEKEIEYQFSHTHNASNKIFAENKPLGYGKWEKKVPWGCKYIWGQYTYDKYRGHPEYRVNKFIPRIKDLKNGKNTWYNQRNIREGYCYIFDLKWKNKAGTKYTPIPECIEYYEAKLKDAQDELKDLNECIETHKEIARETYKLHELHSAEWRRVVKKWQDHYGITDDMYFSYHDQQKKKGK